MTQSTWISAYEARNLAIGLACGFAGRVYLDKTLTAIANSHKQAEINQLMPWNFTQD